MAFAVKRSMDKQTFYKQKGAQNKKILSIVLVVVMVFSIASVSFADSTPYSLNRKIVEGGNGKRVTPEKTRNEKNSLDFKASEIIWREGMSDDDKKPRFSGHYAGSNEKCTYVKDIVVERYQKATYTGGGIGMKVEVYMSIASSSSSDYGNIRMAAAIGRTIRLFLVQ